MQQEKKTNNFQKNIRNDSFTLFNEGKRNNM